MDNDAIQWLRALAQAATPGPWWSDAYRNVMAAGGLVAFPGIAAGFDQHANAAYIAAASPDVLLALLDEREGLRRERDALRAFARDVMSHWPIGDVDGGSLQEYAEKHGLIRLADPAPTEPCGENCGCAEFYSGGDWMGGVECYRPTALLLGDGGEAGR